ncbi:MAG: hypothetical protein H6862_04650 [Rhodospirillales bacterium]|nr:hypothetical protein [Rhodospirillales bacterium]
MIRLTVFHPFLVLFCFGAGFSSLAAGAVERAESRSVFLSSIADIPLMPGFEEMEADLVLFDKPDGRIVEAYALGPSVTAEDVKVFYESVLPRFGWRLEGEGAFIRNTERITLEIAKTEEKTVIRYRISPGIGVFAPR